MSQKIVFYALTRKFLQRPEDMPKSDQAQQVIYQTLALGHHLGVIDCMQAKLECPAEDYARWIERLPEGAARSKLQGALKWGEIMIDGTHTQLLARALDRAQTEFLPHELEWTRQLMDALAAIDAEPAMYLMVKCREN